MEELLLTKNMTENYNALQRLIENSRSVITKIKDHILVKMTKDD